MRYLYLAAALCLLGLYALFGHPALEARHAIAVDELDFGLWTAVCGLVLIAAFNLVLKPDEPAAIAEEPAPGPYVWPMTGSMRGTDEAEMLAAYGDAVLSGTGAVRMTPSEDPCPARVIRFDLHPHQKAIWDAIMAGTITANRIAPHVFLASDAVPAHAPRVFPPDDHAPTPATERAGVVRAKKAAAKRANREARNRRAAMVGVPA